MPSSPDQTLPDLGVLENDDSMLTRKFGKEVVNYYAGGKLNRFSFLRADIAFLRRAVASPRCQFIALDGLKPLVADPTALAYLSLNDVKSLIGSDPFRLGEDDAIKEFDSTRATPLVVFLGLLEDAQAGQIETTAHGAVKGQPFFAVDITPGEAYKDAVEDFRKAQIVGGREIQTNTRSWTLGPEAAAMYAQARSMIDWNTRNVFCAGCGNRNLSVHAGYKRVCPPTDLQGGTAGADAHKRGDCPTRHGTSNVCFPRTDPTMIAAIVSSDGQRVLLGRQSTWPPHRFSCLAGFVEPGESIEEAVRREAWEESGVRVGRVVVHSTQPWPYPSSLMIGAIAQALPDGEEITLNDKELESAKWVSLDEIRNVLANVTGPWSQVPPEGEEDAPVRLPPSQAIAHRLVAAVAEGFLAGNSKI